MGNGYGLIVRANKAELDMLGYAAEEYVASLSRASMQNKTISAVKKAA